MSQKYLTSIFTHIICRQIAVLWLVHCTNSARIASLQFYSSIDVTVDNLHRFDFLLFFYLEADNMPSHKFCFLTLSQKLVFAISSPFQLNFIYIFSF